MKWFVLLLSLLCLHPAQAQLRNSDVYKCPEAYKANLRTPLLIPDIQGYTTLKCDFHIHTVFSDGEVWPSTRVNEAWQDGLDAIAITDHIEYRPRKEQLRGDLNESFRIAQKRGEQIGLMVVHGTEITRNKPFGHMNALFVSDANLLDTPKAMDALGEALKQQAFIMWNHPGWPNDTSTLYDVHKKLLEEKKIHGIEMINGSEYYPRVADWCRQYGVAYLGNSDIHALIGQYYGSEPHARPINLVFATERSEKGLRDALFAARSVTMFNGMLFGPEPYLRALTEASLRFVPVYTNPQNGRRTFDVQNGSDIPFRIAGAGKQYNVPPRMTLRIELPAEPVEAAVENLLSGERAPLKITLPLRSNR